MNEKNQALQSALALINKKFGDGTVMFGNITKAQTSDVIPTGSLSIDIASGIGGLPQGRIVEIYGPEASGKTTLTLHVIAEAQKLGKMCAFIDAEHALDPIYARKLGVQVDQLIINQPDNGEQALEIADELTRSGVVDVIIIDSVAALTPKAEIEGEMGDSHMGLHARLMSQGLRKITGNVKANNVLLVFINQIRSKIGVVYGNPETTTGGNALKFYASMRLEVRRGEQIKEGDNIVGHGLKTKFAKNKMATPFKTVEPVIMYGKGFDRLADILNQAVSLGEIKKAGAWYSYQGEKIGQGKKAAQDWLSQHPDICEKLYKLALEKAQADDYEPTHEERQEISAKDLED